MSAILINPGGETDRESIRLSTSRNTLIPNCRRRERAPGALKEAMKVVLAGKPDRRLRSLTGVALGWLLRIVERVSIQCMCR
jgi:hypothetical protein